MKNCPFDAIHMNEAKKAVIGMACTECGKCVEVCPFGLIVQASPDLPPSKCIACGICAKQCPMEILEVVES